MGTPEYSSLEEVCRCRDPETTNILQHGRNPMLQQEAPAAVAGSILKGLAKVKGSASLVLVGVY